MSQELSDLIGELVDKAENYLQYGAVARADNDDYIGEIKVDIPAGGYPRQSLLTAARAALGEEAN